MFFYVIKLFFYFFILFFHEIFFYFFMFRDVPECSVFYLPLSTPATQATRAMSVRSKVIKKIRINIISLSM